LTNLFDRKEFPRREIEGLYFKRYKVEEQYRDEKVTMEIEQFHSKNINGILQELFAAVVMTVITRTLMVMSSSFFGGDKDQEFQFKNALMTLASEAAVLVPDNPEKAIEIFNEILFEISRVKYYPPKKSRRPQPRVNKRPPNKWSVNKSKKLE
jgi:ABC-type transport system involved in cytochrome bd biosynthesis fused ATPase/permease subunit